MFFSGKMFILLDIVTLYFGICFYSDVGAQTMNRLSPCSLMHSFQYYFGNTVENCILECRRQTACAAINYNHYNKLCALRNSTEITLLGTEPKWCYDIEMDNETLTQDGPCKDNPCNDTTSICLDSHRVPFYKCIVGYCRPETNVANASFRNKVLTQIGENNELVCDEGFTPLGRQSLTCLQDGNWSTTDLQCLKNCPSIPLKSSALVKSWSTYRFVVNTTTAYTCKEGFYNITDRMIVCDKFGAWSEFECLPYCRQADIISIKNGSPKSGDIYTIYTQAEYVCDTDYYLSPGSRFVSCYVSGTWSVPEVACFPFCKQVDIPPLKNGYTVPGTLYNYTMTAQYACISGYYLSDGSPEVTCDTTGTWSTPEVQCYKYCQQPAISNAILKETVSEPIRKDVTVRFDCNDGYYANPSVAEPTTVCQHTGSWVNAAECYMYCGDAPNYQWEKLTGYSSAFPFRAGTVAHYECAISVGMHFSGGGSTKTCNLNGDWSGEVHCCAVCFEYENGQCTAQPIWKC